MSGVLVFAIALLLAVLVSDLAHRSVLSAAVVFLTAGILAGEGVADFFVLSPEAPIFDGLVVLTLFGVLFTDGMRVGLRDLASAWRLPGRALIAGLPLTLGGNTLAAHFVAGLPWLESLLVGAVLAPTDPVFAAALVGREEVPHRIRHLLNVESGLNDGLALPVVIILLAAIRGADIGEADLALSVLAGLGLGITIPLVAIRAERLRFLSAHSAYEPFNAFSIGLLVLAATSLTHANEFLGAFAAGVTVGTVGPEVREAFHRFGELVTELLKMAALLVLGVMISPAFLAEVSFGGYVFAVLVLVAVRPAALAVALAGSGLPFREWFAVAWFGPKGFASVAYALLILRSDIEAADEVFHLVAIVVTLSIIAHSSTDVLVARWFHREEPDTPVAGGGG